MLGTRNCGCRVSDLKPLSVNAYRLHQPVPGLVRCSGLRPQASRCAPGGGKGEFELWASGMIVRGPPWQ